MAETKLTVLITKELQQQAKAAVAMRGDTLSSVVRSALEEYIQETAQLEHDAKTALQSDPLLSLRFKGGPGNVAEQVKEILKEAADSTSGMR